MHSEKIPSVTGFFGRFASSWWNPDGSMKALHALNRARLMFIKDAIHNLEEKSYEGLTVLDVGAGGGLVSEPLARLGARVTALEASEEVAQEARRHADEEGLDITYLTTTLEAASLDQTFDLVLALEVIEHVENWQLFLGRLADFVRPGGIIIVSTLNRTILSYLLGIIAAERILRWVPQGAHHWSQFLKPSEIVFELQDRDCVVKDIKGFCYDFLSKSWRLSSRLDVNYILAVQKKGGSIPGGY